MFEKTTIALAIVCLTVCSFTTGLFTSKYLEARNPLDFDKNGKINASDYVKARNLSQDIKKHIMEEK